MEEGPRAVPRAFRWSKHILGQGSWKRSQEDSGRPACPCDLVLSPQISALPLPAHTSSGHAEALLLFKQAHVRAGRPLTPRPCRSPDCLIPGAAFLLLLCEPRHSPTHSVFSLCDVRILLVCLISLGVSFLLFVSVSLPPPPTYTHTYRETEIKASQGQGFCFDPCCASHTWNSIWYIKVPKISLNESIMDGRILERELAQEKDIKCSLNYNYIPLTTQQCLWLNKYSLIHLIGLHVKTPECKSEPLDTVYLPAFQRTGSFQFSHSGVWTLIDPMDCSTPGLPIHYQLPEFTQIHVHRVDDAIQPSHPLSPSSPALNLSQHLGLFQ